MCLKTVHAIMENFNKLMNVMQFLLSDCSFLCSTGRRPDPPLSHPTIGEWVFHHQQATDLLQSVRSCAASLPRGEWTEVSPSKSMLAGPNM